MRLTQTLSTRAGRGIVGAFIVLAAVMVMAMTHHSTAHAASPAQMGKLEASIFSFDGKDFTRTKTTLMTDAGTSAVGTKLDHDTPAYKALVAKKSYSGESTVFGKKYDANYAPLTGADGKVTGALFVAVAK
ncbi:MAG TPA: Cache 3/Cache 2 fusion domain-containing protein [Gemmatimonadales bacterium]|nr:Cache 3/Cache 2 fusion domain-containing protein [Gemmatimonadales bacterium]